MGVNLNCRVCCWMDLDLNCRVLWISNLTAECCWMDFDFEMRLDALSVDFDFEMRLDALSVNFDFERAWTVDAPSVNISQRFQL